jgi:hypothetical protein
LNKWDEKKKDKRLLQKAGANLMGLVVVLTEGHDWKASLAAVDPAFPDKVQSLGHIPIFEKDEDGWRAIANTL